MRILAVPAATPVMGEEAPREPVVLVLHEDAHAPSVARPLAYVLLPGDIQEQRSCRVHDLYVREDPVGFVLLQPSIVRRKNGCRGTEPIASLEIPVGPVRRTQAG